MINERRTIFYGVILVFTLSILTLCLVLEFDRYGINIFTSIIGSLLSIILIPVILILVIGWLIFPLTLIIEGFKLLHKEGYVFRNLLAIGLGFAFILSPMLTNNLIKLSNENLVVVTICNTYRIIATYLISVAGAYTLSSFLNFFNVNHRNLQYVVVLGSGLKGDKVTPLLKNRINKGIMVYKKQKCAKLIMSGGQGPDEFVAESVAMAKYAESIGVQRQDIIIEDRSKNTEENIQFSHRLMHDKNAKFAIVTNYYHLFRALIIAKKHNIDCIGYGAKTKLYFSLNAFVREFIGYLVFRYKVHLSILVILTSSYILFMLISTIFNH